MGVAHVPVIMAKESSGNPEGVWNTTNRNHASKNVHSHDAFECFL